MKKVMEIQSKVSNTKSIFQVWFPEIGIVWVFTRDQSKGIVKFNCGVLSRYCQARDSVGP